MAEGDDRRTDSGAAARPPLAPAPPAAELSAADLRAPSPLSADELMRAAAGPDAHELLGQDRALDAVRMAIGIDAPGYNVFVSRLRTRRERDAIIRLLSKRAAAMPTPGDWVYVNNFRNPESPTAIYLRAGQGAELREGMRELLSFVIEQLPKAFRREDFDQERKALREKYNQRAQELINQLEASARQRGFVIQGAPTGQVIFIPLIGGRMPESPEELARKMQELPDEERERLARAQAELSDQLITLTVRQQELMRELIDEIRQIERAFAARLIAPAVAALKARFDNPAVAAYLDQVVEHILGHLERLREMAEPAEGGPPVRRGERARLSEYEVNVLVDNAGRSGAPVVVEDAPTYRNLFGTIERWVDPLGHSATNFTRIIGGSLAKAHGGFLVLDLDDAIVEPGVWKMLKRTLKTGRMTLETFEPFPFFMVSGLKPEPLEIAAKVVVTGSPFLYSLLYFYDPEFVELFKVKAELRPVVAADAAGARHYAARVAALAATEGLPGFDGGALARIVEFGMREAGDRTRLLSMMEPIDDLAREAAYYARAASAARVEASHVDKALAERVLRLNFIEEEIRRLIAEGTLIVHLDGRQMGQINGLAVLDAGGYSFGRPSRVTVTVALGQAGVINIEREARLSGSTHDKGVMILSGFFRHRYGQQLPAAMTASIAFEQSYSGIDGDSASSTELYALLSALSGVPLRQDLAVTGSVDQYGTVQAIGGVNEKIEGFYRVCKAIGLTGTQGVLIPRSNLANLMLDQETVEAVARGRFHIYAVGTIDEGIEILTGVRAGALDEPGTINYLVSRRLREMSDILRERRSDEGRVVQVAPAPPPAPPPPTPPTPPR
ncbi:MAG TPA: ATP-binding protein [Candidatus Binataceae bacterium]|nr:ATP-binding protein [Candidatus Binataceae bacterium]